MSCLVGAAQSSLACRHICSSGHRFVIRSIEQQSSVRLYNSGSKLTYRSALWSNLKKTGKSQTRSILCRRSSPYTTSVRLFSEGSKSVTPVVKRSVWRWVMLLGLGAPVVGAASYYALSDTITQRRLRVSIQGGVRLLR